MLATRKLHHLPSPSMNSLIQVSRNFNLHDIAQVDLLEGWDGRRYHDPLPPKFKPSLDTDPSARHLHVSFAPSHFSRARLRRGISTTLRELVRLFGLLRFCLRGVMYWRGPAS
ncbi:hypothetical protein H2248_010253 [Termitomyces sp. 'cryptogamus']|nr:hypothetical protein H2248_010253 [Termitomyces sp. 'cryptogamus']